MKLCNKKTGEIGELTGVKRIVIYTLNSNKVLGEYNSLAELNEDWEDYKPKEPLIKDEKIREAVRAWAKANCLQPESKVVYNSNIYRLYSCQSVIEFNTKLRGLKHEKGYTIAELCGEKE